MRLKLYIDSGVADLCIRMSVYIVQKMLHFLVKIGKGGSTSIYYDGADGSHFR